MSEWLGKWRGTVKKEKMDVWLKFGQKTTKRWQRNGDVKDDLGGDKMAAASSPMKKMKGKSFCWC